MANEPITQRNQACRCVDYDLLGLKAASGRGRFGLENITNTSGVYPRMIESVEVRGHRSDWVAIGERQQKVKDNSGLQVEASLKAQRINTH